jgi:hypothetical protein
MVSYIEWSVLDLMDYVNFGPSGHPFLWNVGIIRPYVQKRVTPLDIVKLGGISIICVHH